MPRWVIYIRGGKGFASKTHILLDEDTRPMVFTSLKAAQTEAAKHKDARVEREPDADDEPSEPVEKRKRKAAEEEESGGGFQLV